MHLSPHPSGFSCSSFLGGGAVVVVVVVTSLLFIVAPLFAGGGGGEGWFLFSYAVLSVLPSLKIILVRERADCFTLIISLMSCD